jgi:hypothetical protein
MLDAIFSMPTWLAGLSLMFLLAAFGFGGLVVVRRWVLPQMGIQSEDSQFTGAITQSVMVFYGLVAALIAVSVWQKFGQVSDIVSGEATAIAALWRDLGGYPEDQRDEMRRILKGYTEQIINEAWPLQHKGQVPRVGVIWMNQFQDHLYTYQPVSEGQKILHAETLRAYNHFILLRNQRLDAVDTGLPGILWLVIIAGAFVSVTSAFFYRIESFRLHATMVVLLSLFIALVIFVIFALDRPFRGDLAITAESYQLIHDLLMKP